MADVLAQKLWKKNSKPYKNKIKIKPLFPERTDTLFDKCSMTNQNKELQKKKKKKYKFLEVQKWILLKDIKKGKKKIR